jgi:hypothetical protein
VPKGHKCFKNGAYLWEVKDTQVLMGFFKIHTHWGKYLDDMACGRLFDKDERDSKTLTRASQWAKSQLSRIKNFITGKSDPFATKEFR